MRSTARVKRRCGPKSDIATRFGIEPVMSSACRSASRNSPSRLPKITRWITSSVIRCIRGRLLSGLPVGHVSSSAWVISAIVSPGA